MQKLTNTLLITATITLSAISLTLALKAIDRITARDCDRGIQTACAYLSTNSNNN